MSREFLRTFFHPTPELTIRLLSINRREKRRERFRRREERIIREPGTERPRFSEQIVELASEDISLRIWTYMAGLARALTAPYERSDASLHLDSDMFHHVAYDLQRDLAIPDSLRNVGDSVLGEFLDWLNKRGTYEATWGIIGLDGSDLRFSNVTNTRVLDGEYTKAVDAREAKASQSSEEPEPEDSYS